MDKVTHKNTSITSTHLRTTDRENNRNENAKHTKKTDEYVPDT